MRAPAAGGGESVGIVAFASSGSRAHHRELLAVVEPGPKAAGLRGVRGTLECWMVQRGVCTQPAIRHATTIAPRNPCERNRRKSMWRRAQRGGRLDSG